MAARGYEFYLRVVKVSLTSERSERVRDTFSTQRYFQRYFQHSEILSAKIVTYRKMSLIAISSHVKDKNSIFTARGEDIIFS